MAEINVVVLVGRLTRDAELKYTQGGMAVVRFSLAINRRKKQGDQWVDEANFFDVGMIGKGAESVHKYLLKGKLIGIHGELRQNRWEQDGKARSKVEVFANTLQLLGGKDQGNNGQPAPQGQSGRPDFASMTDPEERRKAEEAWLDGGVVSGEAYEDDIPF